MNEAFEATRELTTKAFKKMVDPTVTDKFVQYIHLKMCSRTCSRCNGYNRRLFATGTEPKTPIHPNCDCSIQEVGRKVAGTLTKKNINGPDYFLKHFNRLPNYYITKDEAIALGWKRGKDLSRFAPGKMIGGDVYDNEDSYLPVAEGRIWFECDVDYYGGKRNALRLFYSNDGLMFFSPNHAMIGEAEFILIE